MKYYKKTHHNKFGENRTKCYKFVKGKQYCYFKGNWYLTDKIITNIPDRYICGFQAVDKEDLEEISEKEAFIEML